MHRHRLPHLQTDNVQVQVSIVGTDKLENKIKGDDDDDDKTGNDMAVSDHTGEVDCE